MIKLPRLLNAPLRAWCLGLMLAVAAQTSSSAIVLEKPAVTALTTDQLVAVGDPVTFTVTATGVPAPACQWLKNNVAIAGATSPTLALAAATLTDGASYSVRLSSSAGSVTSTAIKLGVVTTASSIVGGNNLATMVLPAQAAGPGLTYQWWANHSKAVTNGGRFSGATASTLAIKQFTVADEASTYVCKVSLGKLEIDSGTVQPRVRSKPQLAAAQLAAGSGGGLPVWTVSSDVNNAVTDLVKVLNGEAPNYPTKFTLTGLPPGVVYSTTTGQISGIPNTAGSYTVKIVAANAAGSSNTVSVVIPVGALDPDTFGSFTGLTDCLGITLSFTVQNNGTYTGSIYDGGIKTAVTGRLDASQANPAVNGLQVKLAKPGGGTYPVTFDFIVDRTNGELSGTMTDAANIYSIDAWRNSWSTTGTSPHPATSYAGSYTAAMKPTSDVLNNPAYPQGNGYLTLGVTTAGAATFAGRTAAGSVIAWSTTLGPGGEVPLAGTFDTYTEMIQGWLQITPMAAPGVNLLDDNATVQWAKTAPYARVPAFAQHNLTVTGGLWKAPAPGSLLFGLPVTIINNNAQVDFASAGISSATQAVNGKVVQPLRLTSTNTISFPSGSIANPIAATLALNLTSGTFSGAFTLKDPNPLVPTQTVTRTSSCYGALVPRLNQGLGFFLLNQLPASAGDTTSNTPALSGLAEFQALQP